MQVDWANELAILWQSVQWATWGVISHVRRRSCLWYKDTLKLTWPILFFDLQGDYVGINETFCNQKGTHAESVL